MRAGERFALARIIVDDEFDADARDQFKAGNASAGALTRQSQKPQGMARIGEANQLTALRVQVSTNGVKPTQ